MTFDWNLLLYALGLALIFEGMPYFLWPEKLPEYLRYLSKLPPTVLRKLGLAAMGAGLMFLFLGQKL